MELIDESLYNDDEITVTYTPGEIFSLDGVKADGFEAVLLVFEQINLLEAYYLVTNPTFGTWINNK